LVSAPSQLDFRVTVADTFQDAKAGLQEPPALLVAEIRLGEYNGLHLVLRGKAIRNSMAAIVTSRVLDPVLQANAEELGATFVVKPTTEQEIRAAVFRTMFRVDPSVPVRAPFERRQATRRRPEIASFSPDRRLGDRRRDATALIHRSAAG